MTAYPFAPMLTLGEFVRIVTTKYDGVLKESTITGPKGTASVRRLIRHVSSLHIADLPGISDNTMLSWTVIRSLCNRLDIPVAEFGLELEDEDYEVKESEDET